MAVVNAVKSSWTLANNKNNELCNLVFGHKNKRLSKEQEQRYYSNNEQARQAFLERKVGGLDLSERVWRYKEQFQNEVEMALDLGIRSGRSAEAMSRDVRQYLKEPNKLFRRVRDEHGQLKLSQRAKAYRPGQGVYRSSYKNARRMTVTEGNIAYHTADHKRREALDFIVGIRIITSNNHTLNGKPFVDICDDLKGDYPKDFKFTGWHPHCRCSTLSIMKTDEEMARDTRLILQGRENEITGDSVNAVSEPPAAFTDWLGKNAERIERASEKGSLPYFIKDNKKYLSGRQKLSALEVARLRHANRTPQQVQSIQQRWNLRRDAIEQQYPLKVKMQKEGYEIISSENGRVIGVHPKADKVELEDNIKTAKVMADSFKGLDIRIREHVTEVGVKNPEYLINGMLADAKRVHSEKGITNGFVKAIKQNCEVIIIDFDKYMVDKKINLNKITKYIDWRKSDFENGLIKECYVVLNNRAVMLSKLQNNRNKIKSILKQLEP